jgi:hypothetical protein
VTFSIAVIIALLMGEGVGRALLVGLLAELVWSGIAEGLGAEGGNVFFWFRRWRARRKRARRREELMKMRVGAGIPPTTYRAPPTPGGHTDEELRRIEAELDAELSGESLLKKKGTSLTGLR